MLWKTILCTVGCLETSLVYRLPIQSIAPPPRSYDKQKMSPGGGAELLSSSLMRKKQLSYIDFLCVLITLWCLQVNSSCKEDDSKQKQPNKKKRIIYDSGNISSEELWTFKIILYSSEQCFPNWCSVTHSSLWCYNRSSEERAVCSKLETVLLYCRTYQSWNVLLC